MSRASRHPFFKLLELGLLYRVSGLVSGLLGRVGCRLASVLHSNSGFLSTLFGVLDGYGSAFLRAIVASLAGITYTLGGALCALNGRVSRST